eukprot:TRINITY_DN112339_c0_g1_i1.p1 TRINITY_DN112339_c0_g1~~TRINITY_DN112339_c0_g1_i1.p1  ORF type:complete len:681 (+),score=131.64 TRINITY_DN112339_c0_g1_i1:158-2200(+)
MVRPQAADGDAEPKAAAPAAGTHMSSASTIAPALDPQRAVSITARQPAGAPKSGFAPHAPPGHSVVAPVQPPASHVALAVAGAPQMVGVVGNAGMQLAGPRQLPAGAAMQHAVHVAMPPGSQSHVAPQMQAKMAASPMTFTRGAVSPGLGSAYMGGQQAVVPPGYAHPPYTGHGPAMASNAPVTMVVPGTGQMPLQGGAPVGHMPPQGAPPAVGGMFVSGPMKPPHAAVGAMQEAAALPTGPIVTATGVLMPPMEHGEYIAQKDREIEGLQRQLDMLKKQTEAERNRQMQRDALLVLQRLKDGSQVAAAELAQLQDEVTQAADISVQLGMWFKQNEAKMRQTDSSSRESPAQFLQQSTSTVLQQLMSLASQFDVANQLLACPLDAAPSPELLSKAQLVKPHRTPQPHARNHKPSHQPAAKLQGIPEHPSDTIPEHSEAADSWNVPVDSEDTANLVPHLDTTSHPPSSLGSSPIAEFRTPLQPTQAQDAAEKSATTVPVAVDSGTPADSISAAPAALVGDVLPPSVESPRDKNVFATPAPMQGVATADAVNRTREDAAAKETNVATTGNLERENAADDDSTSAAAVAPAAAAATSAVVVEGSALPIPTAVVGPEAGQPPRTPQKEEVQGGPEWLARVRIAQERGIPIEQVGQFYEDADTSPEGQGESPVRGFPKYESFCIN